MTIEAWARNTAAQMEAHANIAAAAAEDLEAAGLFAVRLRMVEKNYRDSAAELLEEPTEFIPFKRRERPAELVESPEQMRRLLGTTD